MPIIHKSYWYLPLIGGWSLIGLDEPEPWNINSTTGFIFEKLHGSGAFFDITFGPDDLNSSLWVPYVSMRICYSLGFTIDCEIFIIKNLHQRPLPTKIKHVKCFV